MLPTRSALYIDFDNFFGGLIRSDPDAAIKVVERPSMWLHRLAAELDGEHSRRWLSLRCYLNPAGSIKDPRRPADRLLFWKFRAAFTRAGVEVVDCPTLAHGHKNGADMKIAVDVMSTLLGGLPFDEYVIASADSDFTPLLQCIRANDRQSTVIATGDTSLSYEALADRYLDAQSIFDLVDSSVLAEESDVAETPDEPVVTMENPATVQHPPSGEGWDKFRAMVKDFYDSATEPINLAWLSSKIHKDLAEEVKATQWFGSRSFVRAVRRVGLDDVEFSTHFLWDPARHETPVSPGETSPSVSLPDLPEAVSRYADVTGMPRLSRDQWCRVFQAVAEYGGRPDFSRTEASAWCRDHVAQTGDAVARLKINYVIQAANDGGTRLDAEHSPKATEVAESVYKAVLLRADKAEFDATDEDKNELATWLGITVP